MTREVRVAGMLRRLDELAAKGHPEAGFLREVAHELRLVWQESENRLAMIRDEAARHDRTKAQLVRRVEELESALAMIAEAGGADIAWEAIADE